MSEAPRIWLNQSKNYRIIGVEFSCGHVALKGTVCYRCLESAAQTAVQPKEAALGQKSDDVVLQLFLAKELAKAA